MPTHAPWNKLNFDEHLRIATYETTVCVKVKSNSLDYFPGKFNNIRKGSNIILRQIQVEIDQTKEKINYRGSLPDSLQALLFISIEKW